MASGVDYSSQSLHQLLFFPALVTIAMAPCLPVLKENMAGFSCSREESACFPVPPGEAFILLLDVHLKVQGTQPGPGSLDY